MSAKDSLRDEYLTTVLEKCVYYSVAKDESVIGEDGQVNTVERLTHFHLVDTAYGTHRPKTVLGTTDSCTLASTAHLALQVILYKEWCPEGVPHVSGPDQKHIVSDIDAVWVHPATLGVHDAWYRRCKKWKIAPSAIPMTICIREPRLVYCKIPYLDPRCPTVAIGWKLKRDGWIGIEQKCVHTTVAIGNFDSEDAVKAKFYYQVLLKIGDCMPLASTIPSRQPMLFYRLLLALIKVEPDLGNDVYAKQWKALAASGKVPTLALEEVPVEEAPAPLPPVPDDGDIVIPYGEPPQPPKKQRRGPPPLRDTGARGSGDPMPPPLPPPPPSLVVEPPPVYVPPPGPAGGGGGEGGGGGPPDMVFDDVVMEPPDPVPLRDRAARAADRGNVGWKDGLEGFLVRYDPSYITPDGVPFTANYQIRCKRHGNRCIKKRHATDAYTAHAGRIEPMAFLHAWAHGDVLPGKSHPLSPPPLVDVLAYAEAHRAELEALVDGLEAA